MNKIYRITLLVLSFFIIGLLSSCNSTDNDLELIYEKIDSAFIEKTEEYLKSDSKVSYVLVDKSKTDKQTYNMYVEKLNGLDFNKAIIMIDHTYDDYYLAFIKINRRISIKSFYISFKADYFSNGENHLPLSSLKFNNQWYLALSFPHIYELMDDYKYINNAYFVDNNSILIKMRKETTSIINLPYHTFAISSYAFYNNSYLEKIVLNEGLFRIDECAFMNCKNLKNVYLNQGLRVINAYSFYGCTKLDSVVIPQSVIMIGENAFISGNIFCEQEKKPVFWNDNFVIGDAKVYWKGEWEYDENNIPKPL